MKFSKFQTATGSLKKIEVDGHGDPGVFASLSVAVDPTLTVKRGFDDEGEIIDAKSTVISTDPASNLQSFWDASYSKYGLEFNGKEWQIADMTPYYTTGTTTLEFIEVVLR